MYAMSFVRFKQSCDSYRWDGGEEGFAWCANLDHKDRLDLPWYKPECNEKFCPVLKKCKKLGGTGIHIVGLK
jgi:hypothetical protein